MYVATERMGILSRAVLSAFEGRYSIERPSEFLVNVKEHEKKNPLPLTVANYLVQVGWHLALDVEPEGSCLLAYVPPIFRLLAYRLQSLSV